MTDRPERAARRSGAARRREQALRDPRVLREGVGPSAVALPAPGRWATLLDFLAERFPAVSRDDWHRRMAAGDVTGPAGEPLGPGTPYRPGGRVGYYRDVPAEVPVPFEAEVLYRDAHLLVVDKPHFLPVAPSGRHLHETLLVRLRREPGHEALAPVHRLDRETAGLVLFTRDPASRGAYQALFREREVEKVYEAVAPWRAGEAWPQRCRSRVVEAAHFMQMREEAGEPNAETLIDVREVRGALALYELRPRTGRRHQLRVQMAGLGRPILNDRLYPTLLPDEAEPDFTRPLQLLARALSFTDPLTGQPRRFESRRTLAWPADDLP